MFYDGKVVLVTGGTGFVGTHIVQELLKNNAKVRVTLHSHPLIIKDEMIETIYVDLTKQEDCLKAVKGVEFVFHAAGVVSGIGVKGKDMISGIITNLIMTAQVLQASLEEDVQRFLVFSSSTGYPCVDYPIKEEEMWSTPPDPSYFGYGWMRRYLERLSEFIASKSDMKIAIVRPTAVYGRYDNFDPKTNHVIPALIKRAVEKENPYVVWGTGNEVRDFLHITDLARGCLLMLEKCADCDPVNIGYGKVVTIKEIVNIILKAAGHTDTEVIFDSSKPTTIPYRAVDITKARRLLDFEPKITLEEGLMDTVNWHIQSK